MGHAEVGALSLANIGRINQSSIDCSILTRSVLPDEFANRERFSLDNVHGISVVSLDESFRRQWEPGASDYAERIGALRRLHEAGRWTLVHIEPYLTPNIIEQDLGTILDAVSFADHIFFSGWNYNTRVSKYPNAARFYRAQTDLVRRFCVERGIECEVA